LKYRSKALKTQKVEGAQAVIDDAKNRKQKRMQSLKRSLSTKVKIAASFSKKIAIFPCQSHTALFHTSAPLVELMDQQRVLCPQWRLGTVSKFFEKSGQALLTCDEDGGTADISRAFILAHKEGANMPAARMTDQMDGALPLKIGQRVAFLKQVFLMEHCHGERSLDVDKEGSSAHAFKVWRENHQARLMHQRLHQWSELDFDESDADWVVMDPLAAVHHQRFPGDPATGSGLKALIYKMNSLKARLRRRRSGFYLDRQASVPPGVGAPWPKVSADYANFAEVSHGDDSDGDLPGSGEQQCPLAHPHRPEGRAVYEKQLLQNMFAKKSNKPELHSAHYLSSLYAEAKRVLPMLGDICATVASNGVGLKSRGAQLMGPYHACQLAWNKYGNDLQDEGRAIEHGGGFSRVMGLLSCRIECDDEHDLEEALVQLREMHEDEDTLLKVWHTERVTADRSVYPLMYRLTVEVQMVVKTVAIKDGQVVDVDKRYRSLCMIEVVSLSATNRAEDDDSEEDEQWVGDLAHVMRQKQEARARQAAKVRQDMRDMQVPNARDEREQRERLARRQRWLDWYDGCVHIPGDSEDELGGATSEGGLYCGQTQMCKKARNTDDDDDDDDEVQPVPQPHGFGTMFYTSGARYDGLWEFGRRHGFGTSVEANGERYTGHYRDERRDGVGMLAETGADRVCFHGSFVDGKPDRMTAYMSFSMDSPAVYFNERAAHTALADAARVAIAAAAEAKQMVGTLLAEVQEAIKVLRAQKKTEASMRVSALEQQEQAAKHKKFADARHHTDEAFAAKAKSKTDHAISNAMAASKAAVANAVAMAKSAKQAWLDAVAAAKGPGPAPALPSAPTNAQLRDEATTTESLVLVWERTAEDQGRAAAKVQGRKKRVTKYEVEQHLGQAVVLYEKTLEEVFEGDIRDDVHGPNGDDKPKGKRSVLQMKRDQARIAAPTCTLGVGELQPFERYRLRVRGWSSEGWGEWCNFVAGHTLATPPEPPTKLAVGERTSTTFVVQWHASEAHHSPVTMYELVYREVPSVNPPGGFTVPAQALGVNDYKSGANDLTPATLYEIRVRAKNGGGWGDWSSAVQAKTT
jgi:hypothetical protein